MLSVYPSPAVILDTCRSEYALLKPVSMKEVQLETGFWNTRYRTNISETLLSQYELLEASGRINNFVYAAGRTEKPVEGLVFNDSDVYKWLEAACWSLVSTQAEQIQPLVSRVIDLVGSAQQNDGYLNTFFTGSRSRERWSNLEVNHELYCAGHMIQAAVAHHRVTGSQDLMGTALRLAEYIYDMFGPSKREGTSGHPEIEMALVELYRLNGDARLLELARLFIDRRGQGLLGGREYLLDHLPFRDLQQLAGHAVRALYLCAGAADLYIESGETQLIQTLERLWTRMVHQQVYLTGGVGSRHEGESFGDPYELPNAAAYAETCAAIASVMWNWRMFQVSGNARYMDLLEWTLYNAVLPGISLDGRSYFYVNPLQSAGKHERKPWFDCACCPPNVSRTIAMLPGYIYSQSADGLWINIFASSSVKIQRADGSRFLLRQSTNYPWDGKIRIEISDIQGAGIDSPPVMHENPFSLFIRIPGWVEKNRASIKINGEHPVNSVEPGAYLEIKRNWIDGDQVEIDLPMEAHLYVAHPRVLENTNRAAIARGPVVYCLEAEDNPGINLHKVMINPRIQPTISWGYGRLEGIVQLTLDAEIFIEDQQWNNVLYKPLSAHKDFRSALEKKLTSIPYFCWANRKPGEMQVWTRYK